MVKPKVSTHKFLYKIIWKSLSLWRKILSRNSIRKSI